MTIDTFASLVKYTALNPALTLPLVLLARYTSRGSLLAAQHATAYKNIQTLLALGALGSVSAWLDRKVMNNWKGNKSGEWDWKKEVVVVTGGSDGIGKIIVHLFAEKGVKVAVLDVQELTYEGEFFLANMINHIFPIYMADIPQHPHPSSFSNATSQTPKASPQPQHP